MIAPVLQTAQAADQPPAPGNPPCASTDPKCTQQQQVEEVVVTTGSLIPQSVKETAQPLTVITSADLTSKGFASVADAIQRTTFATGAVEGPQFFDGFTPGAQVVSFFGLSPSYTKYLINGRAIADYPALYNGTDIITDISTIPTVLVDHIDILPGGQSSIYGSDAIAGVVNVVLKQKQDGPLVDFRYGSFGEGGGTQRRVGLSEGFSVGGLNVLVGGQYDNIDPMWGYQRALTSQYFTGNPSSPQVAERDWLVTGYQNPGYYFLDPNNCANVASQYSGTVTKQTRPGLGQFCGTTTAGNFTLDNGTVTEQGFINATYDINSSVQLFTEVLASHAVQTFSTGPSFFSTADDSTGPYYYFADPAVAGVTGGDLLNLQHFFSPEEAGNLRDQMNKNTNDSLRATLGVRGDLFRTGWKYTADFTYTQNKLLEDTYLSFTSQIYNFYSSIFGPNLGPDPAFGQPSYNVNLQQFYSPITPAQYASFTGYAHSHSRTEDSLGRGELTNTSLFHLPGGDAGIALEVEGGRQSWEYDPDARFLDGETYLYTAVAGEGHRARYAGTAELRLPVLNPLTITASGRYDDYQLQDDSVSKFTYNVGLEFRPVKTLLLRGRYGTAFKAPTLSDEFQGQSGFFETSTDFYYCEQHGFTVAKGNINNCSQANQTFFGTTEGNPALQPITATVADVGLVWSPLERSSLSIDYLHWNISNEVFEEPVDQLLREEAACLDGTLDKTSPTCTTAISEVTRDPTTGLINQVDTPKQNLSVEKLGALNSDLKYTWLAGRAGSFTAGVAYTLTLNHTQVQFPGDAPINFLNSPFYSTEFKSKENFSLTWEISKFSTTVYVERYGATPNFVATQAVAGYGTPGAGTLHPWTIANLSLQYEALPGLVFSANINNLFNLSPPFDSSYDGIYNQPYNVFNYNDYGREFFFGVQYKLNK